jgi:hypothetical protein
MFKIKSLLFNCLGAASVLALMGANNTPASAQQTIIIQRGSSYGVSQPPVVGNFIYGSPIATPMPVNPMTGLMPTRSDYYYPHMRRSVERSRLINPNIPNLIIINPTVVNNSQYRRPLRHRSRVLITNPW